LARLCPLAHPLLVVSLRVAVTTAVNYLLTPLVTKRRCGRSRTRIAKKARENAMGINEIDYTNADGVRW
jgi:hypothetical protein